MIEIKETWKDPKVVRWMQRDLLQRAARKESEHELVV